MPLLCTTSPRPTPAPTSHLRPWGHLSTWTSPGSCYTASLKSGSCIVSPPEPPSSPEVLSLCLPHVDRLTTLTRPVQPLIHAPLNALFFLHPKRITTNSARKRDNTICGAIYQSGVSFVNGIRGNLTPPTKNGILLRRHL